jgi:hypothetical protein
LNIAAALALGTAAITAVAIADAACDVADATLCATCAAEDGTIAVAEHDNQGGFRQDNLRDLTLFFRTLSGDFQIPDVVASFFRSHAGPSH